jgi:hypothetical protein
MPVPTRKHVFGSTFSAVISATTLFTYILRGNNTHSSVDSAAHTGEKENKNADRYQHSRSKLWNQDRLELGRDPPHRRTSAAIRGRRTGKIQDIALLVGIYLTARYVISVII